MFESMTKGASKHGRGRNPIAFPSPGRAIPNRERIQKGERIQKRERIPNRERIPSILRVVRRGRLLWYPPCRVGKSTEHRIGSARELTHTHSSTKRQKSALLLPDGTPILPVTPGTPDSPVNPTIPGTPGTPRLPGTPVMSTCGKGQIKSETAAARNYPGSALSPAAPLGATPSEKQGQFEEAAKHEQSETGMSKPSEAEKVPSEAVTSPLGAHCATVKNLSMFGGPTNELPAVTAPLDTQSNIQHIQDPLDTHCATVKNLSMFNDPENELPAANDSEERLPGATDPGNATEEFKGGPAIPYSPSQRILLVGEGDFSFARALVRRFGSKAPNVVATCHDSTDTLAHKYKGVGELLKELDEGGVAVRFNVDATRLLETLKTGKRKRGTQHDVLRQPFDIIVFNFPHVGLGIKNQAVNIEKNRQLLLGFFHSAVPILNRTGEIHVTLKTADPYSRWNVTALAKNTGFLQLKTTFPFIPAHYPGYAHRRTLGFIDGLSSADNEEIVGKSKTFVFGVIVSK